jgi:hypothetical protein
MRGAIEAFGPEIAVRQLSAEPAGGAGRWYIRWIVSNRALQPLRLAAVRLPHGQFKAERSVFEPAVELKPGGEHEFSTVVCCSEPPGPVTENAFLIFEVIWGARPWRIFARVRVVAGGDGLPDAATESITTQSVGFSQEDL